MQDFDVRDDVWTTDFSHSLVFQVVDTGHVPSRDEGNALRKLGIDTLHLFHVAPGESRLPQSPYFMHYGRLHQPYRLYPDVAGAFVVSTVPDGNDG